VTHTKGDVVRSCYGHITTNFLSSKNWSTFSKVAYEQALSICDPQCTKKTVLCIIHRTYVKL